MGLGVSGFKVQGFRVWGLGGEARRFKAERGFRGSRSGRRTIQARLTQGSLPQIQHSDELVMNYKPVYGVYGFRA